MLLCRQNQTPTTSRLVLLTCRHLSSLLDRSGFVPPFSLTPPKPNHNPNPETAPHQKGKKKPPYRPPSSLDRSVRRPVRSDLPFDFQFSYTESNKEKPIGLREPKYSPFGPGRLDRPWTGVCAPAVDPTLKSVDGDHLDMEAKKELEAKRKAMRGKILGQPLSPAENAFLVDRCQKHKTKRQINLGIVIILICWYIFLFSFG